MLRLSVIICTHNPRPDYLNRCLMALRAQTFPVERWELIVIDNASALEKAPHPNLSWHPCGRFLHEPKLGLTQARLLGIKEAIGELLVFVDDDNLLDADYLQTASNVAEQRTYLGSWSGQCRPEFEEPPPEWTHRYWGNLVIREIECDVWSNLPRLGETMPCGAGLCVRKTVAQKYLHLHKSGQRSFQFDRTGTSLNSGGDNDLAACACDIGLGVGLISALKLVHLMPRERFTEGYLSRLTEGIHFSSVLLDAFRGLEVHQRGMVSRIADYLRLLRLRHPHRRIAKAAYRGKNRAYREITRSKLSHENIK